MITDIHTHVGVLSNAAGRVPVTGENLIARLDDERIDQATVNSNCRRAELRSYDQYGDAAHVTHANRTAFVGNALNAVVVTRWQGDEYARGKENVFLTSLPVTRPLEVLDLYDLRSLIENTAFRELKQGWCLECYPKKTEAAVRGHVFLTLVTFTLANAFRTAQGQALAGHGIRRQRAEANDGQVIVFADEFYAIFPIEEVVILLGVVPQTCLQVNPAHVRRRYDLRASA